MRQFWGVGKCREEGYIPEVKRDLTRQCPVPPGSSPGKNIEKVELGHRWAEERWGKNLRARGRKEQPQ